MLKSSNRITWLRRTRQNTPSLQTWPPLVGDISNSRSHTPTDAFVSAPALPFAPSRSRQVDRMRLARSSLNHRIPSIITRGITTLQLSGWGCSAPWAASSPAKLDRDQGLRLWGRRAPPGGGGSCGVDGGRARRTRLGCRRLRRPSRRHSAHTQWALWANLLQEQEQDTVHPIWNGARWCGPPPLTPTTTEWWRNCEGTTNNRSIFTRMRTDGAGKIRGRRTKQVIIKGWTDQMERGLFGCYGNEGRECTGIFAGWTVTLDRCRLAGAYIVLCIIRRLIGMGFWNHNAILWRLVHVQDE